LFVHVLLTKADKLNRGPANKALLEVQQQLKKMKLNFSIQLFSSLNKQGLEELASVMAGRLNYTLDKTLGFDLDAIPELSADDIEDEFIDQDAEADLDVENIDGNINEKPE
jgi:GTP-binding protein